MIPPISSLPAITALPSTTSASGSDPTGFTSDLGNAIDSLQDVQNTASSQEASAAAGQGTLTDTMIAASESSLDTQMATSLIDKALAAYSAVEDMTF